MILPWFNDLGGVGHVNHLVGFVFCPLVSDSGNHGSEEMLEIGVKPAIEYWIGDGAQHGKSMDKKERQELVVRVIRVIRLAPLCLVCLNMGHWNLDVLWSKFDAM